jgi:hypothetical protein
MTKGDERGQAMLDVSPVPDGEWCDRADLYKRPDGSVDESKKRKVQRWVKDGWLYARRGDDGQHQVLMSRDDESTPVWTDAAPASVGGDPSRAATQTIEVGRAIVRGTVTETATLICTLPPMPDPVAEAIARGEPESVLVERVKARRMWWLGLFFFLAVVAASAIGAVAYLWRHGVKLSSKLKLSR